MEQRSAVAVAECVHALCYVVLAPIAIYFHDGPAQGLASFLASFCSAFCPQFSA